MKRLHRAAQTLPAAEAQEAERETLIAHRSSPAVAEGLAAFDERRAPDFGSQEERQ